MVMDEIFGEGNFVATIIWEKSVLAEEFSAKYFSENHDFMRRVCQKPYAMEPFAKLRSDGELLRIRG